MLICKLLNLIWGVWAPWLYMYSYCSSNFLLPSNKKYLNCREFGCWILTQTESFVLILVIKKKNYYNWLFLWQNKNVKGKSSNGLLFIVILGYLLKIFE